ncbi:uncharacterized protein LOC122643475 [Telopea speciosissima]|uniref:uncharacterized protein LOC122643475 n=1 Tax=Telopea speciosissima TaxID=54955 RepID=UPI001CC495C5|nr:uncharacterized protein LOC122643475 [Telopea speciosissima]
MTMIEVQYHYLQGTFTKIIDVEQYGYLDMISDIYNSLMSTVPKGRSVDFNVKYMTTDKMKDMVVKTDKDVMEMVNMLGTQVDCIDMYVYNVQVGNNTDQVTINGHHVQFMGDTARNRPEIGAPYPAFPLTDISTISTRPKANIRWGGLSNPQRDGARNIQRDGAKNLQSDGDMNVQKGDATVMHNSSQITVLGSTSASHSQVTFDNRSHAGMHDSGVSFTEVGMSSRCRSASIVRSTTTTTTTIDLGSNDATSPSADPTNPLVSRVLEGEEQEVNNDTSDSDYVAEESDHLSESSESCDEEYEEFGSDVEEEENSKEESNCEEEDDST